MPEAKKDHTPQVDLHSLDLRFLQTWSEMERYGTIKIPDRFETIKYPATEGTDTVAPAPDSPRLISFRPCDGPSRVILVAGPGGTAFKTEDIEKIKNAVGGQDGVASVVCLGNARDEVSLLEFKNVLHESACLGLPITLVVEAHGENKEGSLKIEIAKDKWLPIAELFGIISETVGSQVPVSIIMTSCHGAAGLSDIDKLPPGCALVPLSPASESTAGADVERFHEVLSTVSADLDKNRGVDAVEFLFLYLTKALENRIPPTIGVQGQGSIDLAEDLREKAGRKILPEQQAKAHARLDSLVGAEEVNRIIELIEGAKSEWDILALDYGKALAVMLALHLE